MGNYFIRTTHSLDNCVIAVSNINTDNLLNSDIPDTLIIDDLTYKYYDKINRNKDNYIITYIRPKLDNPFVAIKVCWHSNLIEDIEYAKSLKKDQYSDLLIKYIKTNDKILIINCATGVINSNQLKLIN